ncbi:MAG: ATP phosphoribosyltransferase [Planctomycetes bacterium]|nr:ATP phosphoribosyltransferase [Planctomycetota bacterium]MBL7145043.1 ATP phosphoribosyltransferase [Phycisphaerae bacterium]
MSNQLLKLGIPAGSLLKATIDLFDKAGFHISDSKRSYLPRIDDEQIRLIMLRAQEMGRYVADGVIDAGITGYDWIKENNCDVVDICQLAYSKATSNPAKWVLAVPSESQAKSAKDLAGGIIATELVNVTKKYFADQDVNVKVEFSWGATEVKARLVDAIVELTETGTSLRANDLRIIDTVITSTTRFIANKQAWEDKFKHEKIDNISILLNAAIEARSKVGLKMNIKKDNLESILKILPAEKSPTISSLADEDFVAIEVIIDDKIERTLVPALKRAGASGIITYPLNKVLH